MQEGRSKDETKKIVSMIGMLVVLIGTIFIITGCPQANGGTSIKSIVEFDSASIKCQKKKSLYTDITTGTQIQEKDKLMFEAILPSGKIVGNWYINDVKQEYKTNSVMSYRVEVSDIVGGKIKISVVFK